MGEQDAILVVDAHPDATLLLSEAVSARRVFALVLLDPDLPDVDGTTIMIAAQRIEAPPGAVSIALGLEDERTARWTITDSGIGIPEASQARLFEKFYRADNAHTVETEGTGLGLYLVRLIVEKLAGQVWCESEEGRGSTFIFTLPVGG